MKEIIIAIVVAVLGSQALAIVVNDFLASRKEKKKKPSSLEAAVMWLLQDRLEELMTQEIKKGKTTRSMKAFIHKGYQTYHELGGNGDMKQLLKTYDELEVDYDH